MLYNVISTIVTTVIIIFIAIEDLVHVLEYCPCCLFRLNVVCDFCPDLTMMGH